MDNINKVFMIIDNYKVIGFSSSKDKNYTSIEITEEQHQIMFTNNSSNHIEYYYVDNELIECELRNKPLGCRIEFNPLTKVFEEMASLEEQIEYYKNLIIEKTRELKIEKLAGFGNPDLELELNELKKIHLEKSHELALQIENRLKEVQL